MNTCGGKKCVNAHFVRVSNPSLYLSLSIPADTLGAVGGLAGK